MDKDAIFIILKEILVCEFEIDADSINLEKRLREDLQLDSLDIVDFVLAIEDHIGNKVDLPIFKNAHTMQDVVDLIQPIMK